MEWIKTSERLPERDQLVLIVTDNDDICLAELSYEPRSYSSNGQIYHFIGWIERDHSFLANAKYWAPFPECIDKPKE